VELVEVPTRGRPIARANLELAEAAVRAWGSAVPRGAEFPGFPGRLETVSVRPHVLLDIAHNPQKARGLARSFGGSGKRVVLVAGVLRGKHPTAMFRALARRCRTAVFTEPLVAGKPALPAEELRATMGGLFERAFAESDASRALDRGLGLAGRQGTVLVTGSAYLVGALRGRWFPDRAVLVQRSSYPV
jgi:dihydrofolate synthase/folylpolyglutamate synthase